jgi:hypothetical protein
MLPINLGLAGQAIQKKEPLIFMDGEENQDFCMEIDNSIQVMDYENVLVCPMFDNTGQLKGVIHMINKMNDEPISSTD